MAGPKPMYSCCTSCCTLYGDGRITPGQRSWHSILYSGSATEKKDHFEDAHWSVMIVWCWIWVYARIWAFDVELEPRGAVGCVHYRNPHFIWGLMCCCLFSCGLMCKADGLDCCTCSWRQKRCTDDCCHRCGAGHSCHNVHMLAIASVH